MEKSNSEMAKQVARAAMSFEQHSTGHVPKSVTAVMSDDTLVITLRAALSPAEQALAQRPESAAQVQELHQQLFNDSGGTLRREIKRIIGVEVREATVQVGPSGGTVVQVFLLADSVAAGNWSGTD